MAKTKLADKRDGHVAFRARRELIDETDKVAAAQDRSRGYIARQALEDYLRRVNGRAEQEAV